MMGDQWWRNQERHFVMEVHYVDIELWSGGCENLENDVGWVLSLFADAPTWLQLWGLFCSHYFLSLSPPASMSIKVAITEIDPHPNIWFR